MRIVVDAMSICDTEGGVGAGIEHYTWSLTNALARVASQHTFFVFVPPTLTAQRIQTLLEGLNNIRLIRLSRVKIPFFTRHIWHAIRFALCRPDVLFAPAGQLPLAWRGSSVVTVHDLFIYKHPEWFSEEQRGAFSTRINVPLSIERATRLLCVSAFTQRLLHAWLPIKK